MSNVKITYFLVIIATAFLKVSSKTKECNSNPDLLSGTVKLVNFYEKNKEYKCIFKKDTITNIQLVINVTEYSCDEDDSFQLKPSKNSKENYCLQVEPFVARFNLGSCSRVCNQDNNCQIVNKNVEVKYTYKKNSTINVVFNYTLIPCNQVTTQTAQTGLTTTSLTTQSETATLGTVTTQSSTTRTELTTTSLTTQSETATSKTDQELKTTKTELSLTTNKGASNTLSISSFVPIVVILVVAIVVLLLIMYIRRRKMMLVNKSEDEEVNNRTERNSFDNMAFETVLETNQVREYATISDNVVYYSAVAEDGDQPESAQANQSGSQALTTHSYEEVTLEGVGTAAQSSTAESAHEHVLVDNILYG